MAQKKGRPLVFLTWENTTVQIYTCTVHNKKYPSTGIAETTSVAGEHRVSECGEQEMEQQDEH